MNIRQLRAWLDAEESRHTPEMQDMYGSFEDTNVYVWGEGRGYANATLWQDFTLGVLVLPEDGEAMQKDSPQKHPMWMAL